MKIYKLIILFILLSISMQGQEAWTLEQCIKRAIEKNISIKQSEVDLAITKQNKIRSDLQSLQRKRNSNSPAMWKLSWCWRNKKRTDAES